MLIVVYKKKEINQTKMRRDTGNYAQLRRGVVLCLTDISLWKNIYPFPLELSNSLGAKLNWKGQYCEIMWCSLLGIVHTDMTHWVYTRTYHQLKYKRSQAQHRHTNTQKSCADTQTLEIMLSHKTLEIIHRHANTRNHAQTHIHSKSCTDTHTLEIMLRHTNSRNLAQTHKQTKSCTDTQTLEIMLRHTNTRNHAQTHI